MSATLPNEANASVEARSRASHKGALQTRDCLKLIGMSISFRTSPDIRAIEDVLTPFIDLDDGDTYRDYEGEKYDCLDDHFLNRQ